MKNRNTSKKNIRTIEIWKYLKLQCKCQNNQHQDISNVKLLGFLNKESWSFQGKIIVIIIIKINLSGRREKIIFRLWTIVCRPSLFLIIPLCGSNSLCVSLLLLKGIWAVSFFFSFFFYYMHVDTNSFVHVFR